MVHQPISDVVESAADTSVEQEYPSAGAAWYCTVILALSVMVNFLDRGILNLLVEPIKRDLNLSDTQMGWIMGFAFSGFYMIFGLPVARMVDRHSRKHIMAAGIAIWSIMTAVCGLATNFGQLFMARVGVGVGETTSGPSAYSLLSDYFPPQKLPRAIAVMNLGFVAGSGLSLIIGGVVVAFVGTTGGYDLPFGIHLRGWQVILVMVGIPGLIVSALMLTVKEPIRRGVVQTQSSPITEVFQFIAYHWRVFMPLFVGLALRTVQSFGLSAWGMPFFSRTYGWSIEQFAIVGGLSLLIAMPIGLFLGSWLAERWWNKKIYDANMRVTWMSTAIAVPLAILQPIMPSPWLAVGCSFLAAIFGGMAAPVENAALQSVTPNHLRGQMTFLFLFIMNAVGMGMGPLVVALLTDNFFGEAGIRWSIFTTALILGPPAIFVFWYGSSHYGKAMKEGGVLPPPPSIRAA